MDDVGERLKRQYHNYTFRLRYDMPSCMSGYTRGHKIFINGYKPPEKRTESTGEELGHEMRTVGNIMKYQTADDRHQEIVARRWGMDHLVTRDDLIELYKDDGYDAAHPDEALGISAEYLHDCLINISMRYGERFTYKGYKFDLSHGLNIYPDHLTQFDYQ